MKRIFIVLGLSLMLSHSGASAQADGIEKTFRELETRAASGKPCSIEDALPTLDTLKQESRDNALEDLTTAVREYKSRYVCIRRLAAMTYWELSTRPDSKVLLSPESATLGAMLVDEDIPIRRLSVLAMDTFKPEVNSPLIPALEAYLGREDAVSTVGPAVATVLLQAAPAEATSTGSVVQYMKRKDQTAESKASMLIGINYAKSRNPAVGREVAAYAEDPDPQISVIAIQTLQSMGKEIVVENYQSLTRIANDGSRAPNVRQAAAQATTMVQ